MNIISIIEKLKRTESLQNLLSIFKNEYNYNLIVGAELEFYLPLDVNIAHLETLTSKKFIQEKGVGQWEVHFGPTSSIYDFITEIENFKQIILNLFINEFTLNNIFAAKPTIDDYGSSLQIHVNFIDQYGNNINNIAATQNSIASYLLYYMPKTFVIYAPNIESYKRFDHQFMAPVNYSYGNNNRTTALRIPSGQARIEHRVAGADVDPYILTFTILKICYLGFKSYDYIQIYSKIFGNAYDPQYNLQVFPKNLNEAYDNFDVDFFIKDLNNI